MKVMLKKVLNMLKITAEVILVIGFIFFEELIWKKLALPIKDYFVSLEMFQRLQAHIELQSLNTILAIFVGLFGLVELLGFYAGALLLSGSISWAITLYVAKAPLAGFVFWMFSFTKDKLLTIEWFAWSYNKLMAGFDWVKATKIYGSVQAKVTEFKIYVKGLVGTDGAFKSEVTRIYAKIKDIFVEHEIEPETAKATAQTTDELIKKVNAFRSMSDGSNDTVIKVKKNRNTETTQAEGRISKLMSEDKFIEKAKTPKKTKKLKKEKETK